MRPVEVDTDDLAEFALGALRVRARVAEASASVLAAGVGVTAAPAVHEALTGAVAVRTHALRDLASLALVARMAGRCYAATEGTIDQAMAAMLLTPDLFGSRSGWGEGGEPLLTGADAVVADAADGGGEFAYGWPAEGWDASVEHLLSTLRPAALERLLVSSPPLARVVTALSPVSGPDADDLAAVLRRAALLAPAPAASLVSAFLAGIPSDRRRRLALLHPRLMVSAAAAPPRDRFAASRVLVSADLAARRTDRLLNPGDDASARQVERRIAWEERLLYGSVELRHPDGTVSRRPHQLLSFDPAGDGRIVEVLGDLDKADHVAVFVPGTGSDLDRYPGTFSRMVPFAAADPTLAIVVWQNADHPDQPFDDPLPRIGAVPRVAAHALAVPGYARSVAGSYLREHIVAAAYRDAAEVAGPALARDVQGLRAAVPGPTGDLTVIGHSYGGSIVGAAELHGMTASRVLHVAGAGAFVDDVRQYPDSAARTRRLSMTAYDDPIQFAQGRGVRDAVAVTRSVLPGPLRPMSQVVAPLAHLDPARALGHGADPDLLTGVVRLDTGVHQDGTLVRGHSGMFVPGSTAWRNLLAVMTRGRVEVLDPERWAAHLEPARPPVVIPGPGHPTLIPGRMPRYQVDRSPYGDPHYRPAVLDLDGGDRS